MSQAAFMPVPLGKHGVQTSSAVYVPQRNQHWAQKGSMDTLKYGQQTHFTVSNQ